VVFLGVISYASVAKPFELLAATVALVDLQYRMKSEVPITSRYATVLVFLQIGNNSTAL
jgi:hypothetical protein